MKNNWVKYVVGIALLLNLLTLGFLLLRRPPRPPIPEERLVRALKLDAEQQKKFEVFRDKDRELRKNFMGQIRALRIKQYKNISTNADSTIVAVGQLQGSLERLTIQHFTDIRSLCHPDQQAIFDSVLLEMMDKLPKTGRD
jgi:periplasmic protein CpxP/Spy